MIHISQGFNDLEEWYQKKKRKFKKGCESQAAGYEP